MRLSVAKSGPALLLALTTACGGDSGPARAPEPPRVEVSSDAERLVTAWFELHARYSPLARPIGFTRLGQDERVSDDERAAIAAASRRARELLAREQSALESVGGPGCAAERAQVDAREDGRVVMDTLVLFEETLGAGFLPGGGAEARCGAVRVAMASAWTEHLWTLQGRDRQAAFDARVRADPALAELIRRMGEVSAPFTAQMTRGAPTVTREQIDALAGLAEELDVDDDAVAALRGMDPNHAGMSPPWMRVIVAVASAIDARAGTDVRESAATRRVRELYDALARGWREAVEHGRAHELPSPEDLPFDPPPSLDELRAACTGASIEPGALAPGADSCVRAAT